MAFRGEETPIEGYSEDNVYNWCIDCMNAYMSKA
jgi:hypothetical protein